MKIDRRKLDIALARKDMTLADVAKAVGVSAVTIRCQAASESVLPKTAGRLAKAIGCDVTEIIED